MKNKVALVVPYFGQMPSFFSIWLQSAGNNPDFDFHIISDCDFNSDAYENIFLHKSTFSECVTLFKSRLGKDIVLHSPYKLCDYKPAYGYVFEELLEGYDFWGFCDIDIVFGNLSNFITDDMLDRYDKLFYHGHFTLMRNTRKMNLLFQQNYPHVVNSKYAFHTKHSCYFDENGTIAYAFEYEKIRFYYSPVFYGPSYFSYQFINRDKQSERYCKWSSGKLTVIDVSDQAEEEIMYVHLQKRTINIETAKDLYEYYIYRNYISNNLKMLEEEEQEKETLYQKALMKRKYKRFIHNIFNGGGRFVLYRKLNAIRTQIDDSKIEECL